MGCLKRIIGLVLLVVVVGLVYLNRDKLRQLVQRDGDSDSEYVGPSAELAESADAKLQQLKAGQVERIVLNEDELQSLLQYKYRQLLPTFVDSPRISLRDGKIEVRGRLPIDRLPRVKGLGDAADFLPDTTDVSVTGQLLPLGNARTALAVDRVRASGIPLPQRLVADALTRMGRKDEPGLPKDALGLRLPLGAQSAYVRGDSLVLIGNGNGKN
jgi:hypothetical protein